MATHSSILAWEIPWTEELGGLGVLQKQEKWCDWNAETEERGPIICHSRAIVSKSNLILS